MINANELRIGNMVNVRLTTSIFEVCTVESIDNAGINMVYYDGIDRHELETLYGIELTEEWLLRLGFSRKGCYYEFNDGKTDYFFANGFLMNRYMLIFNEGVKINYVHQLQNLYFALTQTELTVKG